MSHFLCKAGGGLRTEARMSSLEAALTMAEPGNSGGHDLIVVFSSAQKVSRETAGVLQQIRKSAKDRGEHTWTMSSRRGT